MKGRSRISKFDAEVWLNVLSRLKLNEKLPPPAIVRDPHWEQISKLKLADWILTISGSMVKIVLADLALTMPDNKKEESNNPESPSATQ